MPCKNLRGGDAGSHQTKRCASHEIYADRVELWDRCEKDRWKPHRTDAYDWNLAEAALKQEFSAMKV
jgi:hypothetical protein